MGPLGSPRREVLVRLVAGLALAWGAAYLAWRGVWSGDGVHPVLFWLLLVAEVFSWVSLALFAFQAWRLPARSYPEAGRPKTVDVLVCTYDEPLDVLRATLLGCRSLAYPHTTWLLDDGRRPEMAALAAELGARYVTRPDNAHAKAGNINHALGITDGELIAVLDADHVPLPHFLDSVVGYFDDDDVALVQTPHDFSNLDSIQHTGKGHHEQELFFRVLCRGKDRTNSVFWCGSAAVLRRTALVHAGGVRYETVAEDFHTTLVLHQQGWTTRFHDEVLVKGRAPHDLASFLLQRDRWARGNLRVFRTRQSPLWARGLTSAQRLSYLASLLNYLDGPQRLLLLGVLAATLLTGELPLHGDPGALATLWAPWAGLSILASFGLSRRRAALLDPKRFGLMTAGVHALAALSLLGSGSSIFKVTPKAGVDRGGAIVLRQMWLLSSVAAVLVGAIAARALAGAGVLGLPPMPAFAVATTLALAAFEAGSVVRLLAELCRRRQLRHDYRRPVELSGVVEDAVVRITDLTPHGLGVVSPSPLAVGARVGISLALPQLQGGAHDVAVPVEVRSSLQLASGAWRLGLRVTEAEADVRDAVLAYCAITAPALEAAFAAVVAAAAEADAPLPPLAAARTAATAGRAGRAAGAARAAEARRVAGPVIDARAAGTGRGPGEVEGAGAAASA